MPKSTKKSGSGVQFPVKLHDMMTYVESQGLESAIGWVLSGRGFMIYDSEKLMQVLPLFFGQTKYKSFLRQLNMWDFERIGHGPNKGTYMHPYFVRGNRELCGLMSRQIRKLDASAPPRRQVACNEIEEKELGSFKSEVSECSYRLKKSCSADQFRSTSCASNTSFGSASSLPQLPSEAMGLGNSQRSSVSTKAAEEDPLNNKEEVSKNNGKGYFFCKSYSSFASWGLPSKVKSAKNKFESSIMDMDLDMNLLEPSPIGPMGGFVSKSSATDIIGDIMAEICEDNDSVIKKKCSIESSSTTSASYLWDREQASLNSAIDGLAANADITSEEFLTTMSEEDRSCFAGKQFFMVDDGEENFSSGSFHC